MFGVLPVGRARAKYMFRAFVRVRARMLEHMAVDAMSLRPVTARAAVRLLRPACLCRLIVLVPIMC